MAHVLLAEDDFDFGSILKQYLEIHEYQVTWAKDGKEAWGYFTKSDFDICVFDVMMPKMDGFTLAKKVVELNPEVPFVFLTAKKLKEDKITGLKLGADDYIVKPFEADILVLRLKNILKRTQRIQPQKEALSNIGDYQFDSINHKLLLNGQEQRLTEKETVLIQYLSQNKNGRSMDVFISRLRKYFKQDSNIAIESVRGVGLTFKINP